MALPHSARSFVGLTYLAARVADTLADSGKLNASDRLAQLDAWEQALCIGAKNFRFVSSVGSFSEAEQELLLSAEEIAKQFRQSPEYQRYHGEELLRQLIAGMRQVVRCFSEASGAQPVYAHETWSEFDHYCFMHAGCVGPFWTRIFALPSSLEIFSIEYGKALERINILRDVVEDRRGGRILLPREALVTAGFKTTEPWKEHPWQEFVHQYIQQTQPLLRHAASYCNAIPYSQWRLRWSSALPLQIGVAALDLYARESSKQQTTKITRAVVRRVLWESGMRVILGRPVRGELPNISSKESA